MSHPLKRVGLGYYERGMTIRDVASTLGVSYNTVQLWVSCSGQQRRSGPEKRG
jgi:transposase